MAHFLGRHGKTFLQTSKCYFQFRLSHLIVPHCCWQCLLLQSTTEIANIPVYRDMENNAHLLVGHGKMFLQTSKGYFLFRLSHLIVPHCCWQYLILLQSTTEIANIPVYRDMANNAHLLVGHGKTFLQASKGCFKLRPSTWIVLQCCWLCLLLLQ